MQLIKLEGSWKEIIESLYTYYGFWIGGPAAIRTQDLTVISRALHQAKLRAQKSIFLELSELKGFFEGTPLSDNTFNTRITTYNFCSNIRYFTDPKFCFQDAETASTVLYTILSVWECWQRITHGPVDQGKIATLAW